MKLLSFTELSRIALGIKEPPITSIGDYDDPPNLDSTPLSEIGLSKRAVNALARGGFHKIGDVRGKTLSEVTTPRPIGDKTAQELCLKLQERGIPIDWKFTGLHTIYKPRKRKKKV